MTEAEFKAQMKTNFLAGKEGLPAAGALLLLAQEFIPTTRFAVLCGEALDEAFPREAAEAKASGTGTATENLQKAVDDGRIVKRVSAAVLLRSLN